MILAVVLFIFGLALLVKGGDVFVDSATDIARRFNVPKFLIGATVVSIGTTLPEVMVSATSAVTGHGEIAYGNAIGSIICNTCLIAALPIAIRPSAIDRDSFRAPVVFFFAAAAFYCTNAYLYGGFSRISGVILLAVFVVYMYLLIRRSVKNKPQADEKAETEKNLPPLRRNIVLLIVSAAMIAFGADLLVDNGTVIARGLGVPESVIALTFIALGTSLPELVTAVTSLIKGHSDLSLGNVVGANLFNLVLVCGTSVTLSPFSIPANSFIAGINSSLVVDLPLMLLCMFVLTVPAYLKERTTKTQGMFMLALYAAFCVYQFTI